MASTRVGRIRYNIERFWNFLRIFLRNKRGMLGVCIIVGYGFLVVAAPLITPYDSLGRDPSNPYQPLSGDNVRPSWLKYLPPPLGSPTSSENIFVNGTSEWNFTSTHPSVSIEQTNLGDGSLAITFRREQNESRFGMVTANFMHIFDFPYGGPPKRFLGDIVLLAKGTVYKGEVRFYNTTSKEVEVKEDDYLDIPIIVDVYLGALDGKKWNIYPVYYPGQFYPPKGFATYDPTQEALILEPSKSWILPRYGESATSIINSKLNILVGSEGVFRGKDPAITTFQETPGIYVWGLEVTFKDTLKADVNGDGVSNEADKEVIENAMLNDRYNCHGFFQYLDASPNWNPAADLNGDNWIRPNDITKWEELYQNDLLPLNKTIEATLYFKDFNLILHGSSWGIMGTDQYGRDLFAQLIYGTRISLYVGILTAILGVSIGLVVGLSAGYIGGLVDQTLMRFTDMLLVLPGLPLLIVLMFVLGASIEILILLLGFLGWMSFARLVRSQVLSIRERPFIEAAKAVGAGTPHVIFRHIVPNVMSLVYVNLATSVPGAIVAEASLAWLGFSDPSRMSWGRMLYENQYAAAIRSWWWVIPPGLCIALVAIAFILIGFSLDETLNPRLRRRR